MKKKSKIKIDDFELKITRNDMSNLLIKTQAAMNMKELGFAPELAFERSGLSNDPLSDIAISQEYIDSKWQTQQDVIGGGPEEITGEDGKTQNNYQGNYISGYWRSKNGEKITDNRSPEEQEKAKQEEKK